MTQGESLFLRLAHAALAISGLAWFLMLVYPAAEDPYSPAAHPAQPLAQAAHLLAAPAFLLAVGMIWRAHAWARIRSSFQPRRRSGIGLALLLLPATASGYLLQVSVEPDARAFWSAFHQVTCGLWLLAWIAHRLPRVRGATTGT